MSNTISIFVVGHKEFNILINDPNYISLGVGPNKHNIHCIKTDDEGINISEKNKNYCELTGLYWMWKNVKLDYYGLVHYRRYLCHPLMSLITYRPYSSSELLQILKKYDVILPRKVRVSHFSIKRMKITVKDYYDFYQKAGLEKEDLDLTRVIIKEKYPNYLAGFDKAVHSKAFHYANVIVTNREIFGSYCSFIFDVLMELEKRLDISGYNSNQQRVFGYVSEILIDTFFNSNPNYKIKELPLLNSENSKLKQLKNYIMKKA